MPRGAMPAGAVSDAFGTAYGPAAKHAAFEHTAVDEEAFAKLSGLLRYIDGDYNDPKTFQRLRKTLGDAERPLHYLAIPPSMFATVTEGLAGANPDDFAKTADSCSNRVLAVNESCSINVAFQPQSTGDKSARLTLPTDATTTAAGVDLSGTAVGSSTGGGGGGGCTMNPHGVDWGLALLLAAALSYRLLGNRVSRSPYRKQ